MAQIFSTAPTTPGSAPKPGSEAFNSTAGSPRTAASFGYTRHTDEFILFRDNPTYYENNHATTSYEAAIRRAEPLGSNSTLSYGLEENGDAIHSFNSFEGSLSPALGVHARNQGAGYSNT